LDSRIEARAELMPMTEKLVTMAITATTITSCSKVKPFSRRDAWRFFKALRFLRFIFDLQEKRLNRIA
jgi:hypothetical protein